jgi:hypothetical protein
VEWAGVFADLRPKAQRQAHAFRGLQRLRRPGSLADDRAGATRGDHMHGVAIGIGAAFNQCYSTPRDLDRLRRPGSFADESTGATRGTAAPPPATAPRSCPASTGAPNSLPTPSAGDLSKLGSAAAKGGLTKAGHSLSKHAAGKRAGSSAFPDPKGSPTQITQQAQKLLDDILNDPARMIKQRPGRPGEQLLQVLGPDGSGVIYKWDGTQWVFSHFAENLF